MGNRLSFLNFGSKTGLVSVVMFKTCSVLSLSSVEVPHIRFKFKDVRLNKLFSVASIRGIARGAAAAVAAQHDHFDQVQTACTIGYL